MRNVAALCLSASVTRLLGHERSIAAQAAASEDADGGDFSIEALHNSDQSSRGDIARPEGIPQSSDGQSNHYRERGTGFCEFFSSYPVSTHTHEQINGLLMVIIIDVDLETVFCHTSRAGKRCSWGNGHLTLCITGVPFSPITAIHRIFTIACLSSTLSPAVHSPSSESVQASRWTSATGSSSSITVRSANRW